jgi:hypothetical protein
MFDERLRDRLGCVVACLTCAFAVVSCGGADTGNSQDSGPNKTYLRVSANDADGDALQYQWRVTGGSIENRNAPETVWTMPDGPGLHFAYVTISDGKGGHVEQQYAVSTDALDTEVAAHATISRAAPAHAGTTWSAGRLRFSSADTLKFAVPGSSAVERIVYLPDVQVQVERVGGAVVFSGSSDASGEVSLPDLDEGTYRIKCSTAGDGVLGNCGFGGAEYTFVVDPNPVASTKLLQPPLTNCVTCVCLATWRWPMAASAGRRVNSSIHKVRQVCNWCCQTERQPRRLYASIGSATMHSMLRYWHTANIS